MPKTVYTKTRFENIYTYDTAKGVRYYVRIRYKDHTDTWREKTASGLINLTAAKRKKVELQEIVNKDQVSVFDADKMSFKQLRDAYYEAMSPTWAKGTKLNVLGVCENHLSHFDDVTLNKISKLAYQSFINQKLYTDKLSTSTVKKIHKKMTAIINYAVEEEILTRNKLRKIKIEKLEVAKKEKHLEAETLVKLDRLAKESLSPIKYACYILLRVGLRRGESLGLRKGSVKRIDAETIDIAVAVAKTPHSEDSVLKTRNSYRTIRLQGDYAKAILNALDVAEQIHRAHDMDYSDNSGVIISERNCKIYNYYMPYVMLKTLGETLDAHITPHTLRHSFATHSRKNGNDLVTVASWLGHTPKMSQEVYDHVTKESHLKLVRYANAK